MKRPLAITMLAWVLLTLAALGLAWKFEWAVAQGGGNTRIYPITDTIDAGLFLLPALLGGTLLKWPRGGVLTLHILFATMVGMALIDALHYSLFLRRWEASIGLAGSAMLVAWLFAAALTLPFWRKTPWETS